MIKPGGLMGPVLIAVAAVLLWAGVVYYFSLPGGQVVQCGKIKIRVKVDREYPEQQVCASVIRMMQE